MFANIMWKCNNQLSVKSSMPINNLEAKTLVGQEQFLTIIMSINVQHK